MKDVASWALNTAALRGASYADVRLADDRHRALSTKNGKVGSASVAESFGFGVRVIADGAWGFAASDDLSRAGVEATAARAVEIAKASARVKQHDIQLAAGKAGHRRMDFAISRSIPSPLRSSRTSSCC